MGTLALDWCKPSEIPRRRGAPVFKAGFLDGVARAQRVAMGVSVRAEQAAFFHGTARAQRVDAPMFYSERSERAKRAFFNGTARAQRVDAPLFLFSERSERASEASFLDGAARAQRVAMGVSVRRERSEPLSSTARRERSELSTRRCYIIASGTNERAKRSELS